MAANTEGNERDTLTRPFTMEEARALLAAAHRCTLGDRAFGDAEVGWTLADREVASGYFGSRSYVTIFRDSSHSETSFAGAAAEQLRQVFKTSEYHRNDERNDEGA